MLTAFSKVSLVVLAIVGFVLTFALIVKADFLAENVLGNPKAYYPLVSIAPAIFFCIGNVQL